APALLIQLDTPGGLLPSMQVIVKELLNAPLPVIVYVAPSGAGAGSAGVFITLAAHVAAMAPGTNIGAAHPVGGQGEDIKGKLGLYIEFTHPGVAFPGIAGAICLLLALAALHVLPVNTSALGLLLLGLGLLVAEMFLPTFGMVGAGGLIAFLLGSLFLFDAESGVVLARSVVFGVGGTVGAAILLV